MHIFILSILVQLALVVHAFKTGRNTIWIFVILFFPLIGSLAYVIVELLPELTNSRGARRAKSKVVQVINPAGALRAAEEQYEIAGTVKNAMTLGEQYLQHEMFGAAKTLYLRNLTGLYVDDPELLLGLAHAHFGLHEYTEALACLERLKEKNPQSTSETGHLLYAKCLLELGQTTEAMHELETLANYYPGPEPAVRLAMLLKRNGDTARAREILEAVLKRSKHSGQHYRYLHEEWLKLAQEQLRE